MSRTKKKSYRSLVLLLLLIFVCCGLLAAYFTVFRRLDDNLCIQRMAKRIDVEPNYVDIRMYIENKLEPGLSKEEVESILSNIGPISTKKIGETSVRVTIHECLHPMNHIIIYLHYTDESILDWKRIENPDGP